MKCNICKRMIIKEKKRCKFCRRILTKKNKTNLCYCHSIKDNKNSGTKQKNKMKIKQWLKRRRELKELKKKLNEKIKKEGMFYMFKDKINPYGY